LPDKDKIVLKLFYTAAYYLQQVYHKQLQDLVEQGVGSIPDLFSIELGVIKQKTAAANLEHLASLHAQISGLDLNWLGTYHHVAQKVIKRLYKEKQWARV
jgi:hypothetical protein